MGLHVVNMTPELEGISKEELEVMVTMEAKKRAQDAESKRIQQQKKCLTSQSQPNRQTSQPIPSSEAQAEGESERTVIDYKITQPPALDECSTYDVYRKKLKLWKVSNAADKFMDKDTVEKQWARAC